MPKLKPALALMAILLATALSASYIVFPEDNSKDIYVTGFERYPETKFYLVTINNNLVVQPVTKWAILVNCNKGDEAYISWQPFLKTYKSGMPYGPRTNEYKRFVQSVSYTADDYEKGFITQTQRIWFDYWNGAFNFFPRRRTLVYNLKQVDKDRSTWTKYALVPDRSYISYRLKHNSNVGYWTVYQGQSKEIWFPLKSWLNKQISRQKLIKLYYKTIGAYRHNVTLGESYKVIELVMKENYIFYLMFFFIAATATVLTELIILLTLFSSVTGIPLIKKIFALIPACLLGTGFTIVMLWWVFPQWLQTYMMLTMGGVIFAFLVEALVYRVFVRIKLKHALYLSFACNLASYLAGLWLFMMVRLII